jgi:tetratricopeptide (TPR) repeat protein
MKNSKLHYLRISAVVCFSLFLGACSTTKNTLLHRGWHNMTARYNGYYYSNENIKESIKKVEKANKDDFSKLIPLFIYTDNVTSKSYYSDFDKSIKKSSVVIQNHAITTKKTKEEIPNACKWIDENYMLIGKAHFYKRDLFSALEAFEYVAKIYPNPTAKYGGMLWTIRTNNEIGSYSLSEATIDQIRNAKDFPKDRSFQQEFAAVTADFYIKRGEYAAAIKSLTKAITLTRKKSIKARYVYVLAQLYEKEGDTKKAAQYYAMVPHLHPVYDMTFSAQINRAKLYEMDEGESKIIKKQLMRMLKDDKNIEFQDQIYYALAEVARKEKDIPLAITYLNKSIKASTNNNTQKALSYLKRADIYFERLDYKSAQANYDSTMTFLPKDYPGYESIDEKKKSLTALVNNLNVIALEDSLQRLGKMSEQDRNKAIENIIVKTEEEEKRKKEEELNALNNQQPILENQNPNESFESSNAWYFYNPTTVRFGLTEFAKKWGGRKLEDNWRRSEKDLVMANSSNDNGNGADTTQNANNKTDVTTEKKSRKDVNYYLKSIPLTDDAVAKSNIKIVEAFYNVGSIYKEQLLNNSKSIEAFEELLKRFPENKYKLSAYYQLYRTYLSTNNKSKSDYYKNILLNDYPDTEYAMIIKNPDIGKEMLATKSQVEKFYTETYQLYSEGKYSDALSNCKRADSIYSKSKLMPQFTFLKALCVGKTQSVNEFEKALTQVTIKYPKEPVKDKAQEILDAINKQKNPAAADSTAKEKSKFIFKEDGEYYCIVIVENGKGDIDKFKTMLSNFNSDAFGIANLAISNIFLDRSYQLVTIKAFDGKAKAMDYYNMINTENAIFGDLEKGTYKYFVISAENYVTFYKDKNVNDYEQFFNANYK